MDEIAAAKKLDANEIKGKLAECGAPGTTGATVKKEKIRGQDFAFFQDSYLTSHFLSQKVVKSTAVDRLTDTSK